MSGVLVIGYGNPTRSDDGVGWRVAELLRHDPRFADEVVLTLHQLTPELADDVARADTVVLVDAGVAPAGSVATAAVGSTAGTGWSHHLTPGRLLAITEGLHGRVPHSIVVTVGAASLEPGEQLSPVVEDVLAAVVESVARCAFSFARASS